VAPFVHQHALCESTEVGEGTRIWAFSHVLAGARLGRDCNVCEGVFIESGVRIGDRVTIKNGVQLWDGLEVEDEVFIGPNATFTNDPFPRSRQWLAEHPPTVLRRGSSVGANATILPGIELGAGAMVGAGAVVTDSVPAHAIVMGNPARIVGYASQREPVRTRPVALDHEPGATDVGVGGVRVHRFPRHFDIRGAVTTSDVGPGEAVPFEVRRWFMVYDVPSREVRGEHAHRVCHQFLICVSGAVRVVVDDGSDRREVRLEDRTLGLYLPPMVWASQYGYGEGSALLVLASHEYDPDDYIRDYDEFLAARG
jgi:UDP-2-acetamido-3-amino-2,3-dideoxy-glucuronate N-acetyltransferase